MKRWMESGIALIALVLLFASMAVAQAGAVSGQVLDTAGKPFANVSVTIKSDSGRTFTLKTDKDGKFNQVGVPDGLYTVTLSSPQLAHDFSTQFQQSAVNPQPWNINLQQIAASSGAAAKASADAAAFKDMKAHFDAATAAMTDADTLRKQLASATADQKSDINSKLATDYQTALTEYSAAEQGVTAKDTGNHALIWANIGRANDLSMKYDDAAAAYQKAIDLKPMPDYYTDLSLALVNVGAAQHDPAVLQQKVADASAACDKAVALDTTTAATTNARCYKNMGIVLSNKGDLAQAIDPLKKAVAANPKDAQGWFLLGSAYTGTVQSQTVGDKEVYTFDPGTADAFQKCVDADPTGPYAGQCKDMIASVTQMSGGVSTTIGDPNAKKPTKTAKKK